MRTRKLMRLFPRSPSSFAQRNSRSACCQFPASSSLFSRCAAFCIFSISATVPRKSSTASCSRPFSPQRCSVHDQSSMPRRRCMLCGIERFRSVRSDSGFFARYSCSRSYPPSFRRTVWLSPAYTSSFSAKNALMATANTWRYRIFSFSTSNTGAPILPLIICSGAS